MSKNEISIEQLKIAADCMIKLLASGMTENMSIRHLEFLANNYAKFKIIGKVSADHVSEYRDWSKAAIKAEKENQNRKAGEYLRVEHGTPRRDFARLVLIAHQKGKLNEVWMNSHCRKLWKVAIISHDEDRVLNGMRKMKFKTAEMKWAKAGIKIVKRIKSISPTRQRTSSG